MLRAWFRGSRGVEYTDRLQSPGRPPGPKQPPPGMDVRANRPRHPRLQLLRINSAADSCSAQELAPRDSGGQAAAIELGRYRPRPTGSMQKIPLAVGRA